MKMNAILYVTDKPIPSDNVDWLSTVIGITSAQIRENVDGLVMLITYKGEPSTSKDVPALTELMGLDKKEE